MKYLFLFTLLLYTQEGLAFLGDGGSGWAQVPYLIRIVNENIKRHKQLEEIKNFEKLIHKGIDLNGLRKLYPIGEKTLDYLKKVERKKHQVKEEYGKAPLKSRQRHSQKK